MIFFCNKYLIGQLKKFFKEMTQLRTSIFNVKGDYMKKMLSFVILFASLHLFAMNLKEGDMAPHFVLKNQDGKEFSLQSRQGKWTVLYFYPKAETPGCTKQAGAFRDKLNEIRKLDAEVIGVSVNSIADQASFKKNHNLNFELLADEEGKVTELYGAKVPLITIAKRWTYILDPELKIKMINKDVDPATDAALVLQKLQEWKSK